MSDKKGLDLKQYTRILASELHKTARRNFPTRKVVVPSINYTWAMDLADMSTWKAENDGTSFILTVVDIFTRWADAKPLKTKSATNVLNAFIEVVKDRQAHPKFLWIDEGKEFLNKEFKSYCKKFGVEMYHTYGRGKSVIVERFNRTLKTWMWKELTAENTHEWIPILPQLITKYNNRKHSTIKMTPNQATRAAAAVKPNDAKSEEKVDSEDPIHITKEELAKFNTKFKVGDWVRLSRTKGIFEKGYDHNWTQEIYKVITVDYREPTTYKVEDYNKVVLGGSFYNEELQKTKLTDIFFVEKVLKTKVVNGVKQEYVKWLGWNEKFNSWTIVDQ